MNIALLTKSDKPIYQQIYEQVTAQIVNGDLKADAILPSIRAVALEIGISVITIKKAWELLEREGLIYTVAGKGCFVARQDKMLADKKISVAKERLGKEMDFYRNLGITKAELLSLIEDMY